jgi:hypothetical protein
MINRAGKILDCFKRFTITINHPGSTGMKIGTISYQQNTTNMKKSFRKFISTYLKKIRQQKERIQKLSFSNYPEDFVITDQEEREGGFFGSTHLKMAPVKIN